MVVPTTIEKSNLFHGSKKYDFQPSARILTAASIKKIPKKK